jgi:hypothetical protein
VTRMAQLRPVRFSNRPLRVKRFQTIHPTVSMSLTGSCFSSESHQGRSIMGFEDEGINLMGGLAVRWEGVRNNV